MQDPPTVRTISNLNDKCKTDQTVSAFLYLKGEQMDTEINCETSDLRTSSWERRTFRKSINLKTIPEKNQILGPVIVLTDELEDRSLLSLTCKTTTDLHDSTEDIQWCTRKENNTQYGPLPLQEVPDIEIFNRTFEKTIKSSVLYQLMKSDENVEIICEANHSDTCGSGKLRGTVLFNSKPIKTPNQNYTDSTSEQSDLSNSACVTSDERNRLIYASAGVMTASIIILITGVVAFYKAKKRVKHETSTSSLDVTAADKIKTPKANAYNSIRNNPISEVYQNQISSGGQTYSNTPVHSGGATFGVYDSTEADGEDLYEPVEVPHDEQHVYEGKLQTAELYEDV
ncbi:uncharacterized protein LOC133185919 [Saccostrea echinata]|uniref:uncharacterized protein LOC133185919 n=1 Tax=Saccostrea echinata TaxID=191078 RepID=UPI002A803E0D|nr:uncharacterized protein LOC133185919 [Saccostrea echinata]